jgi:hypothetical protein
MGESSSSGKAETARDYPGRQEGKTNSPSWAMVDQKAIDRGRCGRFA